MSKIISPLSTEVKSMHWSFWLGVSFFILVIVGILSASWLLAKGMVSEEAMPVTSVVISGEMLYTSKADIGKVLEDVNLGNFFSVDVNEIQHNIQLLPWVYSVSVRKQWPNEVKIYVVDQKPVARWNGDFFINRAGETFQAPVARVTHSLPSFFGPEGSERIALKNYLDFNALLGFKKLAVDELILSERHAWQMILSDGVRLNLGREEKIERIQRFMDVYSEIKANKKTDQQVDYIDLRYDTGLAVGWKLTHDKQRV